MLSIERLIPKFVNNMAGTDFKHELNDTPGMDFQNELSQMHFLCVDMQHWLGIVCAWKEDL